MLKADALQVVGRQIAFGMYELLKMCAANIHTRDDWTLIFSILEYVGAGIVVSKSHNIGIVKHVKPINYLINYTIFVKQRFDLIMKPLA